MMGKLIGGSIAVVLIVSCLASASAPKRRQVRFADVTKQARVRIVGDGHGVAVNDYDGDRFIDIYVATKDPANSTLLHNCGDGTFKNVTESAGVVVKAGQLHGNAWGDFDRNGRLGLYVGNWNDEAPTPNTLFEQNADGTFRNANAEAGISDLPPTNSHGVLVGDFDNDGWLDIFAGASRTTPLLLHNNGDGTFRDDRVRSRMAYSYRSQFMSTVDWDEDGRLDIFVSSLPGGGAVNRLYHNLGDGVFEDIGAKTALGEGAFQGGRFADFDNDGHLDLVAPDEWSWVPWGYFVNRGGRLKEIGKDNGLYRGPDLVHALAVGDYDNDGRLDIFMATEAGETALFCNQGGNRFKQANAGLPPLPGAKAGSFFDYDNDGWLDIFVAVSRSPCRLFRNLRGSNHWLKVKLVGTRSNRDGIGARLLLKAGGLTQMREVSGGSGHQQDPFIQHFGLGKSTKVHQLIVKWPGGEKQTLTDLTGDRTVLVEEK